MAAIFSPRANVIVAVTMLGAVGAVAGLCLWWFAWPRSDYVRHVGWAIQQPVPFSHQHHVAGLGIDCRFCHSSVERSAQASLPPTFTCMTCHSQIWTNAALLAPVRDSLASGRPIVWARVTDVPDYVYFNHSIHVSKGVGCVSCHGDVARMPLTFKAKSLTMQFCVDCHRDPGPNLRPLAHVYDTDWHRDDATPPPAELMRAYHIGGRNLTECSICHR
ncbi:cytochrome c3 family protein [Gluconacetobacter takamatsuzukensis]|uniref:Cytochrome c3 family protein n=1 Tax=Gluconacetobacter takamatsuzukensis TaxID=1286190 RepID=A0A7W4PN28_9PROT|nr:cytochrome c3 family protein [Gluconacetobacter takamatsuzukensis]MBB2203845.1 cytochrome c3 family protein [Gluconacetobacter takamatsuzukensis]